MRTVTSQPEAPGNQDLLLAAPLQAPLCGLQSSCLVSGLSSLPVTHIRSLGSYLWSLPVIGHHCCDGHSAFLAL